MSEVNFKSLQNTHESLLQKQQKVTGKTQGDFASEVKTYIEQAKQAGSIIASTRERDQVRANLRYWANYIYSIEKTFPDTELAPSTVAEKRPIGTIITVMAFFLLILFGAIQTFRSTFNQTTETPTDNPVSIETQTTIAPVTVVPGTAPASATPTSVFVGSDVVFTSPENGESVLPKIVFKGTYVNLAAGSTIHMLVIRSDRLYPIPGFFTILSGDVTGEWEVPAALFLDAAELEKPENLAVVPGACFDDSCREKLAGAVETGIAIDALPSPFSFTLYRNSSRVVYRNAYQAIQETRVIYSIFYEDESSFDLYTSRPDGSDVRPVKLTPNVSEMFPSMSPDGTKIVYVKRFKNPNGDGQLYAIAIMNSNGENDVEITAGTTNVLESPQWSPDLSYISYALGNTSRSANATYWSIHTYNLDTGEDKDISGESGPHILNRYHFWIPDSNDIVFNSVTGTTGTSGFARLSMDNQGSRSVFYDTTADEIQPGIYLTETGYILTYTTIEPNTFLHDIYAVIDSDREFPFDGSPIRLTFRRAGELVDGDRIGSADYPIPDPISNSIYYIRNVNIYRLDFTVNEGRMEIIDTRDSDGERYGVLVIETGARDDILGFDVGFMEAFFPVDQTSVTPTP